MNYAAIKWTDVANGPGVRVSLFVSGCNRHCPGCFNPEAQDFAYGTLYTDDITAKIVDRLAPTHIRGLSILGGEPFEVMNQMELVPLLNTVKDNYPNKDIWCYTGFTWDQLMDDIFREYGYTKQMLSKIDYLVDGPFIQELKNPNLRFKGSSNQHIIKVKESMSTGRLVLWEEDQS